MVKFTIKTNVHGDNAEKTFEIEANSQEEAEKFIASEMAKLVKMESSKKEEKEEEIKKEVDLENELGKTIEEALNEYSPLIVANGAYITTIEQIIRNGVEKFVNEEPFFMLKHMAKSLGIETVDFVKKLIDDLTAIEVRDNIFALWDTYKAVNNINEDELLPKGMEKE